MGDRLPIISSRQAIRAFERLGWEVVRQRGSHIIMVKEFQTSSLSVPERKELPKGTLRSLIRTAGITVEEFNAALD